jgi:hypothetical protein
VREWDNLLDVGSKCTHVPSAGAIFNNLRAGLRANLNAIARWEPTPPAKLLILKKLKLAERVGFVPDVRSPINDLALIGSPQTAKST